MPQHLRQIGGGEPAVRQRQESAAVVHVAVAAVDEVELRPQAASAGLGHAAEHLLQGGAQV
jgi:hypothetical protein